MKENASRYLAAMAQLLSERDPCLAAMTRLLSERDRQLEIWGPDQFARIGPWEALGVLTEELGEIARCLLDASPERNATAQLAAQEHLATELTQLGACCLAWLEILP
jgi:hypothetical protein